MPGILWAVPIAPIAIPALYPNSQGRHVTLAYGCDKAEIEHLIGLPASIAIIEECWNSEIQALKAILQSWMPCQNIHPHITVSWVNGSAPVRSNLMLATEHESKSLDLIVPCIIEWIEWEEAPNPRKWKNRAYTQCQHTWKRGDRAGQRCREMTRAGNGYCRKHQP